MPRIGLDGCRWLRSALKGTNVEKGTSLNKQELPIYC